MPTLQLKVSPAREPALYQQLARELTALTAQALGKRADLTAVMIEALPATQWYVGVSDMDRPTAWLEISVTAGTNTAAQKQRSSRRHMPSCSRCWRWNKCWSPSAT